MSDADLTAIARSKAFYGAVFGWTFTDFGPTYSEFSDGRLPVVNRQYAGGGLDWLSPFTVFCGVALIVTRINESAEITTQVRRQLLASPSLLYTVAGILLVLGIVPGMPHLAFLSFAAVVAGLAWCVSRYQSPIEAQELDTVSALSESMQHERAHTLAWEDIPHVERLSVSLGYKLVGLVNEAAGAPLTHRVRGLRQSLSENLGFLLPEIHTRGSVAYAHGENEDNGEPINSVNPLKAVIGLLVRRTHPDSTDL